MISKKFQKNIGYFVVPSLAVVSIGGIGFSSFIIGTDEKETNINLETGSIEVYPEVYFSNVIFSNGDINFGTYNFDNGGKLYANETSEKLEIRLTGTLKGYDKNWDGVRINLRIDQEYRTIFNDLVDYGLIEEPIFEDLTKNSIQNEILTNSIGSFWTQNTTSAVTERSFVIVSKFEWGSFFNYMNPVLFFNSDYSNGIKKGYEYTSEEIKEVINKLNEINGASYTLYLDPYILDSENSGEENNNYSLILDGNGGKFDNFNEETEKEMSNLIIHDKLILPIPYKDKSKFLYWSFNNKKYYGGETLYIDELFNGIEGKTITFSALWEDLSSTGIVEFEAVENAYQASFTILIKASKGNSTYKDYIMGGDNTINLLVGDKVKILNQNGVKNIVLEGFSQNTDIYGFYEVIEKNIKIIITPYRNLTLSFTSSGEENSIKEEYAYFSIVNSKGVSTTYNMSENKTINIAEGETIYIRNAHGIKDVIYNNESYMNKPLSINNDLTIELVRDSSYSFIANEVQVDNPKDVSFSISIISNANFSFKIENQGIGEISNCLCNGDVVSLSDGSNISSYSPNTAQTVNGNNITINITPEENDCFVKGTQILVNNNIYKCIEDLKIGDLIVTFNHYTGKIERKPISYFWHDRINIYNVIKLIFDNGYNIEIVTGHCFLSKKLKKYVTINAENVENFIGESFIFIDEKTNFKETKLIEYKLYTKTTEIYSIATLKNINYVVNTLLCITDGINGLFNYFDLDENYLIDKDKMNEDINKYGLFDYSNLEKYLPKKFYDAFNLKYLNVSFAKGLCTLEDIFGYIKKYIDIL